MHVEIACQLDDIERRAGRLRQSARLQEPLTAVLLLLVPNAGVVVLVHLYRQQLAEPGENKPLGIPYRVKAKSVRSCARLVRSAVYRSVYRVRSAS